MPDLLRWGILGTGNIAEQFATGLRTSRRTRVCAVGSRTTDAARGFASKFDVPGAHGSYDALLADPNVDAIYLSLPNSMHHEWTLKSLAAGKHVLCEKPFAVNESQSREMFEAADRAGKVLIEAFMYLSHPQTHAWLDALRGGAIGEHRLIRTSFCYRTKRDAGNIRFSSELAGGALMDVGCYCTNLALVVTGAEPIAIYASGKLHPTGVDELAAGVLQFPGGVVSTFSCGMTTQADNTAQICGTEGYIEIPIPWKPPMTGATWTIAHATPPRQDAPRGAAPTTPPRDTRTTTADRELYALEADDFAATVFDGVPPRVPRELTLSNVRVLDKIRSQLGLSF
jgi:predicted dehydrogenase